MRPIPWPRTETGDPMDVKAARRAMEDEPSELAFEIGLHVQQLEPQHLRLERDGV